MNPTQISLSIAFIAGLASFLSPCVLPLVPIYLAQLVGPTVYQATIERETPLLRMITFFHAIFFVLGFTLAFVALGATASTMGSLLSEHVVILRQIGGVILVLFGLHLVGILKIPLLLQPRRIAFQPTHSSFPASFLIGVIFGCAWTPCFTPILSAILILAARTTTLQQGVWLLLAYSLGLGVPFLLLGLGLNWLSRVLTRLKPYLNTIEIGTGIFMVIIGAMIFFNMLTYFNAFFNQTTL
ncbi:cytochrome C biogenesis protein CcdA [Ktedonobacteria bacterium brp13]|nr:cytochrome C biogenesis protein CcdA [Ktedonobacteria bacterium brp13]